MKDVLHNVLASKSFPENAAWQRLKCRRGDVIVKRGEVGRNLYYVEQGELLVSGDVDVDQNKQIHPGVSHIKAGGVFGEMCLCGDPIRSATVTAVTDVELLEICGEKLSLYLDDNPIDGYLFYRALFSIMAGRIEVANNRVENLLAWGLKAHQFDKHLK